MPILMRSALCSRKLLAGLAALVLCLCCCAACEQEKPKRVIPRETSTFVEKFKEGDIAPNFSLQNINVATVDLEYFRGKLVILNFWATFSPGCIAELPGMEQVYRQFRERGLAIVAVNLDPKENRNEVIDYVKNNRLSFPILVDSELKVKELYGVRGLPETFFIDPDGKFVTVVDPVWANNNIRLTSDFPWNSRLYSELIDGLLKKYEGRIKEITEQKKQAAREERRKANAAAAAQSK